MSITVGLPAVKQRGTENMRLHQIEGGEKMNKKKNEAWP